MRVPPGYLAPPKRGLPIYCSWCPDVPTRRLTIVLRPTGAHLACECGWWDIWPAREIYRRRRRPMKLAGVCEGAVRRLEARRLRGENIGLFSVRNKLSHGPWGHVTAVNTPVESAAIDQYDIGALFPLYVNARQELTAQERRDGQGVLF